MEEMVIYKVTIGKDNNYRIYIHKNWYHLPKENAQELIKIIEEDMSEKRNEWRQQHESSNNY